MVEALLAGTGGEENVVWAEMGMRDWGDFLEKTGPVTCCVRSLDVPRAVEYYDMGPQQYCGESASGGGVPSGIVEVEGSVRAAGTSLLWLSRIDASQGDGLDADHRNSSSTHDSSSNNDDNGTTNNNNTYNTNNNNGSTATTNNNNNNDNDDVNDTSDNAGDAANFHEDGSDASGLYVSAFDASTFEHAHMRVPASVDYVDSGDDDSAATPTALSRVRVMGAHGQKLLLCYDDGPQSYKRLSGKYMLHLYIPRT